jgi:bifunctional non-homologous end joining protein LigD
MKAHLFYKAGSSDKEYVLELSGSGDAFTVNALYGRRGAALRPTPKTKGPVSYSTAAKVYNAVLKEKVGEGYRGEGDNELAPEEQPGARFSVEEIKVVSTPAPTIAVALPKKQHSGLEPCELLTPITADEAGRFIVDNHYAVQTKEDGNRRGVRKNGGLHGLNRKGEIVPLSPEIQKAFEALDATEFYVDGEDLGDTVKLWDILSLNGESLRDRPYRERLDILRGLVNSQSLRIRVVATWFGEKAKSEAILKIYEAKGEGVVFKDLRAPFRPGRAAQHFKLKFLKDCTVRVCQKVKGHEHHSVSMELFDTQAKKWVYVGNLSLPSASTPVPPVGSLVEVRYLQVLRGGHLQQACFQYVRDDVDESAATLDQLVYKDDRREVAA